MRTLSVSAAERCVNESKYLIESTSTSKSSIRTACSVSIGYRSIMSPRTENCPLPSTWASLSYPIYTSVSISSFTSNVSPMAISKHEREYTSGDMRACMSDSTDTHTAAARPDDTALRVFNLAAVISVLTASTE